MTIKIETNKENGKNLGNQKETVRCVSVVANCRDKGLKEIIKARWYMGRSNSASTIYCTIWLHGGNYYNSGHGNATGGGYCKESASFQSALDSAGIKTSKSTYGRGMESVFDCLQDIASFLGYDNTIVVNHG